MLQNFVSDMVKKAVTLTAAGLAAASLSTAPAGAQGLPHVVVLATGGTIAGSGTTGGGYVSGAISGDQLIASVPDIGKRARLSAEQIASIGSQDMNDGVWLKLAERIAALDKDADVAGIVITHGTDTMEETALFLDLATRTEKPIVLVGSMRPSTAVSADGPRNLLEGVIVASDPKARGRGALVVLNDTIHGARDVTKTNTVSVQTFLSPNFGPVGAVSPDHVAFFAAPAPRTSLAAPTGPLPKVEIIYAYAGVDAKPVEAAVAAGAKGIVLAGVGDGNASKATIAALQAAAKGGVVVVRSSRTGTGPVLRNIELNDDELGFVAAAYHNPPKARVLLQLLLAGGVTQPEKVQAAFAP
ncbi:L-asparaginase [Azorhizobium oxalatiphilum]|uniref:L-asparaginase n=1 Tax=Azorhizobium oxalatiphilum TaxID=980631 RepID=A0A917CAE9_9HYPH|nr:asparaginase [Azorhizobium oxalatiphilum]GGF77821.1 L-asparaginase [Azorhizobium oxalatiphilum]